jgi:dipeptidyl aminopeptidase/acylaminoacyl peptidase
VSQGGVADLEAAWELGLSDGVVGRLLGGSPAEVPERYAAASPSALVPLAVPVLLVHGALDDTVPVSVAERFALFAEAAGDEVALDVFPEGDHMGHIDPADPMWEAAARWLEPWLAT